MARNRRSSDPAITIQRLASKHASIDARVAELSDRVFLTSDEQVEARQLKKQKLALKEQMDRL